MGLLIMTDNRKAELFQGALEWIWDHTEGYGIEEYVIALEHIGFTTEEIQKHLSSFGCDYEYNPEED